jgi:hypothetical protein
MNHEEFIRDVVQPQFSKCLSVLGKKRKYRDTTGDRLVQFRIGAALRSSTSHQALAGMMSKHSTQLYTMIEADAKGEPIDKKEWEEVITDHINYLLLLKAIIQEEQ